MEIVEVFVNNLCPLLRNLDQLTDAQNEIGTKVDLYFTRVSDRFERMKAHMATVQGNAQLPNSRICNQKVKMKKVSRLSHSDDDKSTSSDEHREDSETDYESDSSS